MTLTVGLFGTFGFKEAGLYDEYMKLPPNITIKEDIVEQSADYYKALQTRLAAGSGLADVQAIEIGFVADVVAEPRRRSSSTSTTADGDEVKANSTTGSGSRPPPPDGKTVGLGTDIGPQAICYRQDLFEAGRLPADREQLGEQWATWDDFIAFGKQYEARDQARQATSSTARPASSPPRSTRATRPTTTPTATPTSRTATASDRLGLRQHGRGGPGSPPGSSSSPTSGTRRSPAARSPPSPAPPG